MSIKLKNKVLSVHSVCNIGSPASIRPVFFTTPSSNTTEQLQIRPPLEWPLNAGLTWCRANQILCGARLDWELRRYNQLVTIKKRSEVLEPMQFRVFLWGNLLSIQIICTSLRSSMDEWEQYIYLTLCAGRLNTVPNSFHRTIEYNTSSL